MRQCQKTYEAQDIWCLQPLPCPQGLLSCGGRKLH